ncbi:hypothetical protein PPERSA_12958 [Pseudocohnilembus persalinus]|uniref:P-loop containing nucleoside triphosphate hydrolase n=1 Tax=Pseudocohnilembus persalinus TaxID=266149 RepID=A0A0V0R275_PSEPJ|nr:hypothetical protein PPERSA_12958 [Pseudocohnilembus persalinus]|eukprot:KRX08477.1 hypothetical protein PPERSA_12958 [Pseudocohnilembus persalinus]
MEALNNFFKQQKIQQNSEKIKDIYKNQNVLNLDSFINQCQNQQFLNIVDQSIVYKQNEYDPEFNVSFCYLVPNKITSLIKFQSLEKLKIVFLNYENPEQIKQIFINQQNDIKNFLEKVNKKEIVVDKNLIDKKILESFLKCRDPISMIQGQIKQKEKLLENYPLKQNIELIQNFEILANLAQKTCQRKNDNFDNNQDLQNLANYIVNQKLETKLVSTSIVNCFLVMSVPCSGKSTLAKKFKELRKDKENIYSGSISTDQIVSIAMEKIKNEKNNDLIQNQEEQNNKTNKSNKVFQNLKNEQQKKDNK